MVYPFMVLSFINVFYFFVLSAYQYLKFGKIVSYTMSVIIPNSLSNLFLQDLSISNINKAKVVNFQMKTSK